jgi:hypothetical membrane protein
MANSDPFKGIDSKLLKLAGIMLFLSGPVILMGIITGEIFQPPGFSTRASYISELGASIQPGKMAPEPSATIFNLTMIIAGLTIIFSAHPVHRACRKLFVSIPLLLFGVGILGVGLCPGDIVPWHGIFAMIIFVVGGIAAITSSRMVSSPLKIVFIILGIIALFSLVFSKRLIPLFGVGGTERWIFYPLVFWIMGLGSYLSGLVAKTNVSV